MCKTHTQWSKIFKQVQSRVIPNNGTQLSPKPHKNVIRTFYQTHDMFHCDIPMGNAWTHGNRPHGANTDTHKTNGTQPNQNFEKNFSKTKFPTPLSKNPQF